MNDQQFELLRASLAALAEAQRRAAAQIAELLQEAKKTNEHLKRIREFTD